jgi:hypothetical protein
MSSLLFDRLLLTFNNVKHRLQSLLNVCRIYENSSGFNDDDDCDEFCRFDGPYRSDIEELEESIVRISLLIENFQHEQDTADDCKPFPNYPLCENHWTLKKIEQLEEEECLNLIMIKQLSLHTLNGIDRQECLTDNRPNANPLSSMLTCDTDHNLLDLPPELLLHILSFLSPFQLLNNLAPTCRYFANLILTRVYSHLDLSQLISVFDVSRLLSYLPYLRSITFIDWENDVSILTWAIWFDQISKTTSNFHTIRFQKVDISPILICLIVEYFPHCLQTITFDYQQQKSFEKFDLVLALLGDQRSQLKNITASYQLGITNFGILQLVNNLNIIVELNLLYIEAIKDE